MNLLDAMALNTDIDEQRLLYGSYKQELTSRKAFHDAEIIALKELLRRLKLVTLGGNDVENLGFIMSITLHTLEHNEMIVKQTEGTIASIDELLAKLDSHGKEEGTTKEA